MISFICGSVVDCMDNAIVLKSGTIGYEISVSSNTLSQLKVGQDVELYCYLQVKDDGIALFGFATADEKAMFCRLITVSGVGCKLAQAILSGMDSNRLALAIYNGDIKSLTSIKGLGKKTAERLVLELKEKVNAIAQEGVANDNNANIDNSAVNLLVALGLSMSEATKRVELAISLGANSTEDIINMALRIS